MDPQKLVLAVQRKLCWVCGEPLGAYKTFVIGPMCIVNRTSVEPPSHLSCGEFSVKACPFLTRPGAERREMEGAKDGAGVMLRRNPGVTALWTTKSYALFKPANGGVLFELGDPRSISFWREGRLASHEEIRESVTSGLPLLVGLCESDIDRSALQASYDRAQRYLVPHYP